MPYGAYTTLGLQKKSMKRREHEHITRPKRKIGLKKKKRTRGSAPLGVITND